MNKIWKTLAISLTLLFSLGLVAGCGSDTQEKKVSAIEQIKQRGKVRIAVFSDKPPFGFVDADGKRASEFLMQKYYVAASVNSIRMKLFLQKFEDYIAPENAPHIEHAIEGFPEFIEVTGYESSSSISSGSSS